MSQSEPEAPRTGFLHFPALGRPALLVAAAALSLLAALWAALDRIGVAMPSLPVPVVANHGALMIGGFLGTLVSLERAVALGKRWGYLAPLLSALGALALMAGLPDVLARILLALSALALVAIFAVFYRRQPVAYVAAMGVGALLWLAGNTLWAAGVPTLEVVPWWAGFLVLTIGGERLELSRLVRVGRIGRLAFNVAVSLVVLGLALTRFDLTLGLAVSGAGLLGLGLWLLRNDIARRTLRLSGLSRYIAACLLPGYGWLALGGALWLLLGAAYTSSPFIYDAMLHCLFLGFVVSMTFGHAPIILPAALLHPPRAAAPRAAAARGWRPAAHPSLAVVGRRAERDGAADFSAGNGPVRAARQAGGKLNPGRCCLVALH